MLLVTGLTGIYQAEAGFDRGEAEGIGTECPSPLSVDGPGAGATAVGCCRGFASLKQVASCGVASRNACCGFVTHPNGGTRFALVGQHPLDKLGVDGGVMKRRVAKQIKMERHCGGDAPNLQFAEGTGHRLDCFTSGWLMHNQFADE
jgi:hypothetical protein